MVSPPVLKSREAVPRGEKENVEESAGLNLVWCKEQEVQFAWGRSRPVEPVSMRTELVFISPRGGLVSVFAREGEISRPLGVVMTYKFRGGVPTAMVVYHCRSVWLFLIQSVKDKLIVLLDPMDAAVVLDGPCIGLLQAVASDVNVRKVFGRISADTYAEINTGNKVSFRNTSGPEITC